MRKVKEWRGKSDDARVPPRVRLRIFLAHHGKCYLSGRPIHPGDQWDLEHKVALCNGGEHAEFNLAPALKAPHKVKTGQDRKIKKRNDARRKKHIGIHKPRTITRWRRFNGEIVIAGRER
jgi:5-methylcytosine-specific restriction protein A